MVLSCCAPGCRNKKNAGSPIKFYRFPLDRSRRMLWISAIRWQGFVPTDSHRLCSDHFISGHFSLDPLHPDFAPSIFDHVDCRRKEKLKIKLERYLQTTETKRKRGASIAMEKAKNSLQADAIAAQQISMVDDVSHHVEPSVNDVEVQVHLEVNPVTERHDKCIQVMPLVSDNAVQVQILMDDNTVPVKPMTQVSVMVQADVEYRPVMIHVGVQTEEMDECYGCVNLRVDKLKLQACLGPFSEQDLKDDNKKVNFYTGLPTFSMLDFIVKFVSYGIPLMGKLSPFQEVLLVLMKLRLNLEEQDLAYRFCVSQSTVSNVFRKWIYTMAEQLSFLIHWPSREQMMTSMPMVFRTFFKNCICILDCTEIFIERPSNLQARSHTWSEYKHHNTIKVLIAVTPQGTISFISEAWGGRASDKYITEHSGVLDKLEHGDIVLADRGFTIEDSVSLYCAKLCCPPFTKGKKQLSRSEVDSAREISHVRIHVERVIGQMKKKFQLLEGVIPISMLNEKTPTDDITFIDCIFTVCAALCNVCTSVVPLTHAHY